MKKANTGGALRFAYLSSGRDLLRTPAKSAKGTMVFAGPDYKLDPAERQVLAKKLVDKNETIARAVGRHTKFAVWVGNRYRALLPRPRTSERSCTKAAIAP